MPLSHHWEGVIEPLIRAARPRAVVEVGVSQGATTTSLLELAEECDFVVHGIDPAPGEPLDVETLTREHEGRFVFHRAMSLDALPGIREPDVVLLDGDHNWYTVYHELKTLERVAAEERRDFPLTLLHDIDWPYGRRDMYFFPESVPAEHRQEFERAGLIPFNRRLARDGGFGAQTAHAIREGTPRNGVRTALEDFTAEAGFPIHRQDVPGFHGVAVILPVSTLEASPAVRHVLEQMQTGEWMAEHCRLVELARVRLMISLTEARRSESRATED